MKSTSVAFNEIALHDSKILRIVREDGSLIVHLDVAGLSIKHPENPLESDFLICENPKLRFNLISKEESRFWDDIDREWRDHTDPSRPLDNEIMENDFRDGYFFLDGFHASGWSEWRIWASEFELEWEKDRPYENILKG